MGKIFTNYSSNRELISRIYKELKKLNTNQNHIEIPSYPNQNGCCQENKQQKNADEAMGRKEPLYTDDGNVNLCSHYGKQCGDSSKKLKLELPMTLLYHPGCTPEGI
jgi:hypothetical protein